MIHYEEWEIVYQDSNVDVRKDPQELEGYGLNITGTENYLLLPRGTLREIATSKIPQAKRILENLMSSHLKGEEFFKDANLNNEYLISALTKTHLNEEKRFKQYLQEIVDEKSDGCCGCF